MAFLTANTEFAVFITNLGFRFVQTNTSKYYYVNDKGSQIAVDYDNLFIILLNNKGYVTSMSSNYTEDEIINYSKINYD